MHKEKSCSWAQRERCRRPAIAWTLPTPCPPGRCSRWVSLWRILLYRVPASPKTAVTQFKVPWRGLPHPILGVSFHEERQGKSGAPGVATGKDISSWHLSSGFNNNCMYLFGVSVKSEAAVWRDEVCVPVSDLFSWPKYFSFYICSPEPPSSPVSGEPVRKTSPLLGP